MSEISNKPSSSSVFEFLKNEKCCESDFFEGLEKSFDSTIGEISDDVFAEVAQFCSNLTPLDDDRNITAIIHEAESLLKKDFKFFPSDGQHEHDPEKSKVNLLYFSLFCLFLSRQCHNNPSLISSSQSLQLRYCIDHNV
jgi:hypothetical protein